MPSIEQVIREVTAIKQSSDSLASSVAAAGQQLSSDATHIASLVKGSSTGQQAVAATGTAARSLSQAAASMQTLSGTCDEALRQLVR